MTINNYKNLGQIFKILDEISPFSLQEEWDNSGLQIGCLDFVPSAIYTTLEVDFHMLKKVAPNSLIISHHPLIFKSIKELNFQNYPANLIQKIIQKQCALISMHTNFDLTHLNFALAQKLGLDKSATNCKNNTEPSLIHFSQIEKTHILNFANSIKSRLNLKNAKLTKANDFVENIALVCGAGFSLFPNIAAKNLPNMIFLTGDIKYHDAMIAKSLNISLFDIGHFESEAHFAPLMAHILENHGFKAIISNSQKPFMEI